MMADVVDVEDLARAASSGDAAALDTLLTTIRPEMLRVCARFLPHREDAEEACQDTLFAIARGISRFDGRSTFRTWAHRIAANRSRSTYQVLRRRFAESATAPLPERPDPRRTSVVAGTRIDLLDGLEVLGTDLAEPLVLRDVLDMPYREVATLLDLPEGTVKSRIHEGRRRLRGWLIDGAT